MKKIYCSLHKRFYIAIGKTFFRLLKKGKNELWKFFGGNPKWLQKPSFGKPSFFKPTMKQKENLEGLYQ